MIKTVCITILIITSFTLQAQQDTNLTKGYTLVWADEFNKNGKPDSNNWSYEIGFVRNEENQWYQPQNAYCKNGVLILQARKDSKPNPNYIKGSSDWTTNRKTIDYTSSSINTMNKQQWLYGRFVMCGKIDISEGMWPAWWLLGVDKTWPLNGEIDMMEYYNDSLLANICFGAWLPGDSYWYTKKKPVDANWASRFHTWRLDWDSAAIAIYVDDTLLNKTPLDSLVNKDGSGYNPFKHPQYMLFDFAIGGQWGGDPSHTKFPKRFEVDYVRVYQKKENIINK